MGYRWKNNTDVDEAVVVIMNSLDKKDILPTWLVRTVQQSIEDSDPVYVKYFYKEVGKHAPAGMKFFEDSGGSD
ncbi:hypothetical protein L1S32_05775 [Methanogenium sp. S4BF]|uniref:hypothetical protein n=1 Tax=Methanogenium sp. S4BF TaxID=1789226 RepID=UPI002415DD57|nr:hypothetical protein [Methanogenium sp. S4BF]WFN35610.1 hypothetical protein L1S32_05775 [Methanogenium sp. S4BF]